MRSRGPSGTLGRTALRLRFAPLRGRLARRLLVWFLLLSLIPLFASNTLGYLRSRVILEGLVNRYLNALTQTTAMHVQGQVERHAHYLEAIAAGNEFLAAGVRGRTGFGARGPAAGNSSDGPGGLAAQMEAVANRGLVEAYLERKLREVGVFEALYLLSPQGEVVAWTGVPPEPSDDDLRPGEGAPYAVTASRSEVDSTPCFRLLVPVVRLDGTVAGYLGGSIGTPGSRVFFQISEHTAGSIETFIVDADGRPLFVSHPHGPVDYSRPLQTPLLDLAPGWRARYRDRQGVEVIGTSAVIPGQSWRLITEAPLATALAGLQELRRAAVLLEALFVLLVAGVAWFVAGGIVAPVSRLVEATQRVGRGHLHVRVKVDQRDEIGELGHAFNEMTAELARASARVRELHQREIERAQQLATVGELASGVAHEIKNPVVGIAGGLDLVKRRLGEDPELVPIIEEMTRQLSRIGTAVHDLLSFARPATPTLAPVDANHVVRRAARLVQPAADRADVLIDLRLPPSLPELHADEELICQALVNLLMNAVQASARGGHITLSTGEHDGHVEIRVADTGHGIPPQELQQIFKPFYTTRHTGTGLGLPITREIVERHGGRIEVESRVGMGSAFTLLLPVHGERSSPIASSPMEVPS